MGERLKSNGMKTLPTGVSGSRGMSGFSNGDPMDWRLIFRIATEVTEEEWKAGQEVVAARIAEIQADFLVQTLPQVEEVFENAEGLYDVRGSCVGDLSKLIDSVLQRVTFALDTAVKSNSCDLNEMSLACKILRHALEHASSDPNTLEACLRNASSEIRVGLESGFYGEDGQIRFLVQTLDETALQLRADHPDVAQATYARMTQRLREIDDAKRLELAQRIDVMQEGSAPRLRQEFGLAAEITRSGASMEAKAEAIKQSANRAGKISLSERAKQAEGSGWMSATKIGLRAKDLVDMVIGLLSGGGA